jgi:hypothetical protein
VEERDPELEQTLKMVLAFETAGYPMRRRPEVRTDLSHHLPLAPNTLDRRFDGWLPSRAVRKASRSMSF